MKKVLLVCPALPEDMPYLRQYMDFLDNHDVLYDLAYMSFSCNRDLYPDNYEAFVKSTITNNIILKLWEYYAFSRFIIRKLSKGTYTHVITMGIASSIFIALYLKRNFKNKYIYDIRDYSRVLNVPVIKYFNKVLLKNSYLNVISSGGFKVWLPTGVEYVLSHNTTKDKINDSISYVSNQDYTGLIKILTIGQLRDYDANLYVINQLCNNSKYELIFSGKGMTMKSLENYAKAKSYSNVLFTGKYKKEDEDKIADHASFINVCMGDNVLSNYLLSNRLYLAARLKKPLISFDGSYQSEIINKYNLGLIIKRTDDLSTELQNYINSLDYKAFIHNCDAFLEDVRKDIQLFQDRLESFIESV